MEQIFLNIIVGLIVSIIGNFIFKWIEDIICK